MARVANRQNIVKAASRNKVWYVAFYIRLSREDKRGKDESESITNQRLILTDFLQQQDDDDEYIFVDEYVDDGVSGTTDEEREGFQRLLTDIGKKKNQLRDREEPCAKLPQQRPPKLLSWRMVSTE